jgi:LPS sulfotransferase NodH
MHDIIKLYSESGKVGMVGRWSLFLYSISPNIIRQLGVYSLYQLRKNKLPGNRFVIFAQGRTGSTLLGDLMNSHPDIFVYGEIMQANVIRNLRNPRLFASGLCSLSRKPAVGFKVKIYQLERDQRQDAKKTLEDFHRHGWKIIYLKRMNILRHAISDIRSDATGMFHQVKDKKVSQEGKGVPKKIRIESELLISTMKFRETYLEKEKLALATVPYLTIEYEKDLFNPDVQRAALNRLFEFLELPPHDAETSFKKVTSKNIADDVENFDELEQVLHREGYESYLDWG